MKGKLPVVVIFGVLMMSFSLTLADDIMCEFEEFHQIYWWLKRYGCKIKSITPNFGRENSIKGTHMAEKNDNDVKAIQYDGNLESLNLTRFDSIFCRKFPNLELIHFNNLLPALIDENALRDCNKLESFQLSSAKIRKVPENFLSDQNRLTRLSLEHNQIDFLPSKFFKSLNNLEFLDLANNRFQALDPAWFENLQNIVFLYLEKNKINELPRGVFAPLVNLVKVLTHQNQLTVIHADSFGVHDKLERLTLASNKLNAIDEHFLDILIASPAFREIDTEENECVGAKIKDKIELKQKFSKCIENYVPRFDSPSEYPTFRIQNSPLCGLQGSQVRSVGSDYTKPHNYPWLAALQKNDGSYFCGGTLITDRKVVTAAHCIQPKGASKARKANEIKVLLGAHNLSDTSEENRKLMDVKSIHMHHYWRPNSPIYDYDIAVIVLSRLSYRIFRFSHFIRPLCQIPSHPSEIEENSNLGIVVGYGYNEEIDYHNTRPKALTVPMMAYQDCKRRFPAVAEFASPRTFCGGWANGTGVCSGDSGNALMIKYRNRYYLRGIISSSSVGGMFTCGENKVAVFTDIMFFTPWINDIVV